MKISSTENISIETISKLSIDLSPFLKNEVDENQYFFKSFDPPTWIKFIAEADWWVQALAAAATIYISELIKESAKHTWKSISKNISTIVPPDNSINMIAEKTFKRINELPSNVKVYLAIPLPDEYNCTMLEIEFSDLYEASLQISLFIYHLPELMKIIDRELAKDDRILGSFYLEILDNGSLKVYWKTLSFHSNEIIIEL